MNLLSSAKRVIAMFQGKNSGYTLVELVISVMIIGVALTGTLLAFQTATRYSADPMLIHQSMAIANSYLTEALNKEFLDSGSCPVETSRDKFTHVCQYHGLTNNGAKDQRNQSIAGLESYTVSVLVDDTQASLQGLVAGTEVVRVDVSVTHPKSVAIKLSGYKTKY